MNTTILSKMTILTVFQVLLFAGPIVPQNPRGGKQIPEFKKSAQVFEAGTTVDVVLEDFDADGDADALISNLDRSLILVNDGKGGFSEKGRFPTRHGCSAAGDIDSDGDVDLVALPRKRTSSFESTSTTAAAFSRTPTAILAIRRSFPTFLSP